MISAVILAGGDSTRLGSSGPKALLSLNGQPMIQWSIDVIEPFVDEVVVVAAAPYRDYPWAPAGATRSESARSGMEHATGSRILIHDGARPVLSTEIVRSVVEALETKPVVDTAVPITDGLLWDGIPVNRHRFWLSQTPEGFWRDVLAEAFDRADGSDFQDEVTMVHRTLGLLPHVVPGVAVNSKVTVPQDVTNLEGVLRGWNPIPPPRSQRLPGRALMFGGSGAIGSALMARLPDVTAPTRHEVDLTSEFVVDLSGFDTVIHAAAEYQDPELMMAVNFDSVRRLCRLALDQEWQGNIVVFSSTAARYGRRGIATYSASKAALNTWIEASHVDLAASGIRINAVAPAKVAGRLQATINPTADQEGMLSPGFVADRTIPWLTTSIHGRVEYLRVGLEGTR